MGLFSTQVYDNTAGALLIGTQTAAPSASPGSRSTSGSTTSWQVTPEQAPAFNPDVFTLYGAWDAQGPRAQLTARASVQRGERLFNGKPIVISGVRGVNDVLGVPALQ